MARFNNVRMALHCLETTKSAFNDKINILNNVRTQLQNSWKSGTDRDRTFVVIQRIQNICNDGSRLCQNAINEVNAALEAAEREKNKT